ncbi:fatty acid-binding protein-like [Nymphalis io]|uniref:fatty acid-binding protein-like n=1 Tax=Inachis io TaxID=171585 RepID=UPI002169F774|nr:fatty acid-binding protein-like [Nymphalis io]XP_050353433.1 fatty acid-binding protein-like [Nymphalis io]
MEDFLNKEYVLQSTENFEDYLEFMGISYFNRKIACNLKMVQCLERNEDGTYTFHFKSKFANSQTRFTPGEEFEETKADGVKVKALITLEGDEMTHIQIESNGRTSRHVRKFYHDKLIVTTTAVGFDKTVTRVYGLVNK